MRFCASAVFLLAIPVLVSCAGSANCFRTDVFCAALVTDTLGIDDHGINQDAWAGLQAARANGLVDQIEFIESIDTRDYEKNIAYFAQNGYDAIVTSGVGLQDATLQAADLYPDPVFIAITQPHEEGRPNLVPIPFAEDQIGFLAGALAARLTETHVVGAVCEASGIPSMWRYCEGFRAGVLAGAENTEKEIRILIEYRDDGLQEKLFIDEAWGIERAQYLIKRGADVIFAAGGVTGQGALRAASEAGIHAIGTERDQAAALGVDGSSVVTSIYGRAGHEVQEVMRELGQGKLDPPVSGQFGYVPLGENFPESLKQDLDALLSGLLNGYVQTNVPFEKP
jgi:basic membrane protein A and related proteins